MIAEMPLAKQEIDRAAKVKVTPHVCVCICTYQRPELLRRLLDRLCHQSGAGDRYLLSCVVVDNDVEQTAAPIVTAFEEAGLLKIEYHCETERNFAVVRNCAIQHAAGDFVAFIDDDEVPEADWLLRLLETIERHDCDGALGPVRPYFDQPAPDWLERSRLCHRPVHPTGLQLTWRQTRSGNVLLRRDLFQSGLSFDPAYRTGGEDVDFFKRAIASGRKFIWCEEAPAYELVPPERMRLAYHLRRALLQGSISLKYNVGKGRLAERVRVAAKSALALLLYSMALPFSLLLGAHRFVRLLVKTCHHLGRFSTLSGIPIIRERNL